MLEKALHLLCDAESCGGELAAAATHRPKHARLQLIHAHLDRSTIVPPQGMEGAVRGVLAREACGHARRQLRAGDSSDAALQPRQGRAESAEGDAKVLSKRRLRDVRGPATHVI